MRSIRYLVEFADLPRAHQREGQHVPERKTEIVHQHVAPRFAVPFIDVERCQQHVEVARRRIEIYLDRQPVDHPVDLGAVTLDQPIRVVVQFAHFVGRRLFRKNGLRELMRRRSEARQALPVPNIVEHGIEAALEPVDDLRIEIVIGFAVQHFVQTVLPFDQEMEPPFAILDVERKEKLCPSRQTAVCRLHLRHERSRCSSIRVRRAQRSITVGDGAGQRRPFRHIAQLDDDRGEEIPHRHQLQADIPLIGKSRIVCDLVVHLFPPMAQFVRRYGPVQWLGNGLGDKRADLRPRAVDDGFDARHLIVEFP